MNRKFDRLVGFVLLVTMAPNVHAYIDPGSGSIIIQGTIAAIAAIGMTIKIYWYKIKGFFRRQSATEASNDAEKSVDSTEGQ